MDIEDRAAKWAREYEEQANLPAYTGFTTDDLIAAYLAGSARTQRDYVAHYEGNSGHG